MNEPLMLPGEVEYRVPGLAEMGEVKIVTSLARTNEMLAAGWVLLAIEGVTYPERLPGEGQGRETPFEERTGYSYVRRGVSFVLGAARPLPEIRGLTREEREAIVAAGEQ